jgi:hypothetical protein
MNDDELKKLWQQQTLRVPDLSAAQVISAMQNKMSQFRATLRSRDIRELVACLVVIIIFGFYFFHHRAPISRVGDLIVIGGAIFIAWKLMHTRRITPPAPPGATIVESLSTELNSVRAQSGLLGSVLWWYLLPLTIGELAFVWGGLPIHYGSTNPAALWIIVPTDIVITLVVIAVNAQVYWLNQRARRKQLLPLEAQLESLIRSAETGEPLDETHVANLRPIVLSMAAAEQVKPVELKVAFWQVALFGEIGFVGFWFFLMLGLPVGNEGSMTKEPGVEMSAQNIPAVEANRYSIVAQKVIELLNARDYAGVQRLFNRDMSEFLPPQKASAFFTDLAAQFGRIEKFDGPTTNGYRGWIAFQLHCQHGEFTMSLALDAEAKISGIHFRPASKPPVRMRSLVLRVFRWQRLIWIVPFFLAGLVYSRIIQKTTARAVGISSLGIHLSKGQNLIVWDEIKEVRPLKILHVQNLWLIRESGEKTLMHWTPLERHSELKTAVESFAPANHPIRKYLSLLKRS